MNSNITAELLAIESVADSQMFGLPRPHPMRDISIWHILTVFEDVLRFLYVGHVERELVETMILGDLNKYSLRHCLEHIFRTCDASYGAPAPKRTIPPAYTRAFKLFEQGIEYFKISKVFTSLHCNHSIAKQIGNVYEIEYTNFIDTKYAALELFGHGREHVPDITSQIYMWFRDLENAPVALQMIGESTKIKNKFVSYEYGALALLLSQEMWQRPIIIPNDWIFPWGSAFETNVLINSFLIRCTYHFLAINLSAIRSGHSGGAESSLVLAIDRERLCHDLALFADFEREKIASFVDHLTYGFKTQTPDPALQPIIPTINGTLLIPCLHVITSDIQRNLLSLTARVYSTEFNKQSNLFEIEMTKSLKEYFNKFPHKIFNKKLKINGQDDEFDILLVDMPSQLIIIFELRWILQPGDPREIANKMKECVKKVEKLERKIEFCQKNIEHILNLSFPGSPECNSPTGWQVCGVVVIEGFGGVLSGNPNLPIVTSEVLKIGLSEIDHPSKLIKWMQSLDWLPQRGIHYEKSINELAIDTSVIRYSGFELLPAAPLYREFVHQSLDPFR